MRKRTFINALLFGALIVAPASTFVSCSDYDDDIAGLRNDLDATNQRLDELTNQKIAALEEELSNLQDAADKLNTAVAEGDEATLAAAQELVNSAKEELQAAIDSCKASCSEKIDDLIAADADLSQAINDVKAKVEDALTLANELGIELDGLQTTVNTLSSQYSTLSDKLEEASQKIAENAAAIEAQKAALGDSISDVRADMDKLEEDLAAQKAELEDLIAQEVAKVQENVDDLNTKVESIKAEHDTQIQALQSDVDALEASLQTTQADLLALKDKLTKEVNVLSLLLGQELRSLVFKPTLYVDGVEAAEYGFVAYTAYTDWVENTADVAVNTTTYHFPKNVLPDGTKTTAGEYDPVVYVQYHMNPSSAQIADSALSFISRDAEFITRANESKAKPTVDGFTTENGILSVGMRVNGSAIYQEPTTTASSTEATSTESSIFALQAKVRKGEQGDTLITSDYAMLYATKITPNAIAFSSDVYTNKAKCAGKTSEIYTTLQDVMQNAPTLKVKFDDQTGLNLADYLEMHYSWDTPTKNKADHASLAYADAAKYGLSYKFDLVDYTEGDEKVSDSKYAILKDSVLVAATYDAASGNTSATQGRDAIGREPLVRVTLVDGNGNVVLYGFLKVQIVEKVGNTVTEPAAYTKDVDVCEPIDLKVTDEQVAALVSAEVGMSADQFAEIYQLSMEVSATYAQQYAPKDAEDPTLNEFTTATDAQAIGDVTPVTDAAGNYLKWTIPAEKQQAIYESDGHTATTYIAYVPKVANSGFAPIYVPLTVTFNEKAEAGAIVATKLDTYWKYGPDANSAGMNVLQPTDGQTTTNWITDVHQIWEGSKITVTEQYKDYQEHLRFYFLSSKFGDYELTAGWIDNGTVHYETEAYDKFTNTEYEPTANNERNHALDATKGVYKNTHLFCNGQEIAAINPVTGVIQMNNNSSVLKEIVNKYPSFTQDAPQAFLNIGMYVYNNCDVVLPLTDDSKWFSEYILRPINVEGNNSGNFAFVDAKDNGSTLNLGDVLDFSDWRNQPFKNGTDYSNVWYYAFYGIKSVTVDEAKITTNINSADNTTFRLLSEVAPQIDVTQTASTFPADWTNVSGTDYNKASAGTQATWDAIRAMFGTITYRNNGNPIGEGNVLRLPIIVEYDWGTLETTVDISIKTAYNE